MFITTFSISVYVIVPASSSSTPAAELRHQDAEVGVGTVAPVSVRAISVHLAPSHSQAVPVEHQHHSGQTCDKAGGGTRLRVVREQIFILYDPEPPPCCYVDDVEEYVGKGFQRPAYDDPLDLPVYVKKKIQIK